jgi:hypothetical protein
MFLTENKNDFRNFCCGDPNLILREDITTKNIEGLFLEYLHGATSPHHAISLPCTN